MTSISGFGSIHTLAMRIPKKKVGNFVGGVGSPILANIYLHEFDEFMEQKKQEFDQGKKRQVGRAWKSTTDLLFYHRRRIDALKGDPNPGIHAKIEWHEQRIRELSGQQKRLPASDPLDPKFKRLFYVEHVAEWS